MQTDPIVIRDIVRGFTSTKLPDPENHKDLIFISKILPKVEKFISLERDDSRNLDSFLERLERFSKAVPAISCECGEEGDLEFLEAECKKPSDEHILALTVVELKTMVDDFRSQIEGASREVNTDGFSNEELPKISASSDRCSD